MPQGQGTVLWNLQTQSPEWVDFDDVSKALSSGQYRAYSGSTTNVEQGIGGEAALDPEQAATAVAGGGVATGSEAARGAIAAHEDNLARHSGIGDKALALASHAVSAVSGGLLKGIPGEDPEERALREEANPGSAALGDLAALAAAVFQPESLIKYTPLGLAGEAGSAVASAVKGAGGIIRGAGAEALGGAAAGAILGSTNQIGNAITGGKVSPAAVVDDIGLGALIGGGLGLAGGVVSKMAGNVRNARAEVKAAAGFDESAKPVAASISDASDAWHSAHEGAKVRLKALNQIANDHQIPEEWLAARNEAAAEADKTAKALHKVAGTDDPVAVGQRIAELASSGKAKQAEKLFHAFNEYGTAVSRLDDAMRPVTSDLAFTGDLHDMAEAVPAQDNVYQQVEAMIKNGASAEEIQAFQHRVNDASGYEGRLNGKTPESAAKAEQATGALKPTPKDMPTGKLGGRAETPGPHELSGVGEPVSPRTGDKGFDHSDAGSELVGTPNGRNPMSPDDMDMYDLSDVTKGSNKERIAALEERLAGKQKGKPEPEATQFDGRSPTKQTSAELAEQPVAARRSPAYEVEPEIPGRKARTYEPADNPADSYERPGEFRPDPGAAGRRADHILDNARKDARPVMPSELGDNIQAALNNLQAATGGRLGSAEARALAKKLGMDTDKLTGPVASRLVDLWGLHRMAEAVAEGKGAKASALEGVLRAAGASVGYKMGGYVGARAIGTMVGAASGGLKSLVSTAGRLKQDAILGMAKVLSPMGRKAITLGAIGRTVSTSYSPGAQPTTSFDTKAKQLRQAVASPDAIKEKIKDGLKDVAAIDPVTASGAMDVAFARIQALAKALPNASYWGPFDPPGPPSSKEMDSWHEYEAVTHDRNLVFDYIKSGHVPEVVKEAMMEQHGDFMQELSNYIAGHQDEVSAAPPRTKQALSQLLGVSMGYEADPEYIARLQLSYQDAKQKAAQKMGAMQQSQAIKAGIAPGSAAPLPGQMMAAMSPLQQR